MVTPAADLAQFVQRRELLAYEARLARAAYAYGVDLRRSAWLDHSTVGEPLMRAVDRRWPQLLADLGRTVLQPPSQTPPTGVMEELLRIIKLLRAPTPTLRLLRGDADRAFWPIVTPLGTTRGAAHLLVVDPVRCMQVTAPERSFLLASALGTLQCDHGPLVTGHLMAYRDARMFRMVRAALWPWNKVAVFSSDRAALLASGDLEQTIEALRLHGSPPVPWWPRSPKMQLRVHALEDFDKSRVMTRLRLSLETQAEWTMGPGPEDRPPTEEAGAAPAADAPSTEGDVVADAEAEAERLEAERLEAEQAQEREAMQKAQEERLQRAWPLARCDQRLTRRLGLL